MSITTEDAMINSNYEEKVTELLEDKYSDFSPIEDIEPLAMKSNWCQIRTWKLMPTMFFMQRAWRKLWELVPDDEYISWVRLEYNILTYYKPQPWK